MTTKVTPNFDLKDDDDVRVFLLGAIRDLRKGEITVEEAHAISALTDKYIKHKVAVVIENKMINSKELRVENWVYSRPSKGEVQFWEGNFSQRLDTAEGNKSIFELIDPIPLTEENIKRFGISGSYQFAENFTLYVDGTDGVSIEEYWEGAFPLEHIKYLHQLQNLYFALTGNELKLTP